MPTSNASPIRYDALTTDGWTIALHRYAPPKGRARGDQSPVLLCHGLGANRYNLDAPGDLSFARWLNARGFDCWVVELRGAGRSSRPTRQNGLTFDWTFDDYVNLDIPAALDRIAQVTGHSQVHWVGHSMGGMVAYAFMMTRDQARIRSATAVGSPSFAHVEHPVLDKLLSLRGALRYLPKLPYSAASFLLAPVMPVAKHTVGWLFGNPHNLSTVDLMRLVCVTPTDLPPTLILQFADWYAERGFSNVGADVRYYEQLHRITAPTFIVAGAKDLLTPPKDLQHVHDSIGSEDKQIITFGKRAGCRYDYGHIDLILGRHAEDEVWPHILSWIESH